MFARAGRRAGQIVASASASADPLGPAGFDPLSAPPPAAPAADDAAAAAPEVPASTTAAPPTVAAREPPATFGLPSAVQSYGPFAATPRGTSPQQQAAAPPVPTNVAMAPLALGDEPSWIDSDVSPPKPPAPAAAAKERTERPAVAPIEPPHAVVAKSTPEPLSPKPPLAPAAQKSPSKAPQEVPSLPAKAPEPSPQSTRRVSAVLATQDALVEPLGPLVPAPLAPSLPITRETVGRLQADLSVLEAQEAQLIASCSALISRPMKSALPDARSRVAHLETEKARLTALVYETKMAQRDEVDVVKRQHANTLIELRTGLGESSMEHARSEMNALASQLEGAMKTVERLRRDVAAAMADREGYDERSAEDRATLELNKGLHTLFLEWRRQSDQRAAGLLRDRTRATLAELAERTQRLADSARSDRKRALATHRTQREQSFSDFRKIQREGNRRATDAFFAALSLTRKRSAEETRAAAAAVKAKHDREMDEAAAQARAQARGAVEAALQQHRQALQDEWLQLEGQLRRAESIRSDEANHKRKLAVADLASLRRRFGLERQHWVDVSSGTKQPATARTDLVASIKPLVRRSREVGEAANVAMKGLEAARRLPTASRSRLNEREAALQVLHSKLAARGDGLEKCWSELKGQCEQLKEAISRTAERASEGRSAISVAQQQLDAVRQSWERDERAALSKAQLPTADKSYCDVLYDIAEQLRVVNEQSVDLRRARSEHGISVTTLEDDLEEQHTAFIKTIFSLLSKYDEVAAALATVESKRRQLDAESEDQRLAKLTLDTEWKDIAHHADRLRTVSSTIQKEAALVAANPPPLQSAADNRYAYGYHVPASRSLVTQQQQQQYYTTRMFSEPSMAPSGRRQESTWADFSTLLRVPDDTSVGSASHRTGPRSQSITTPSPDTES
jgi:hypothetical protein